MYGHSEVVPPLGTGLFLPPPPVPAIDFALEADARLTTLSSLSTFHLKTYRKTVFV